MTPDTLLRWVVRLLTVIRFRRHMRWDLGYEELCEVMKEELDFHYEASSIRRMRKSLRDHRIYVPRLYSRYSSRRVLVTEFIHAALMTDFIRLRTADPHRLTAWLDENRIDPRRLARQSTTAPAAMDKWTPYTSDPMLPVPQTIPDRAARLTRSCRPAHGSCG